MLIIDGDYPMALAMVRNRDLTLPIDKVRTAPVFTGHNPDVDAVETMASLPEMRRGGVAAALVKVVVDTAMTRPCRVDPVATSCHTPRVKARWPTIGFLRPRAKLGFCALHLT